MAIYTLEGPDGKKYRIEGPEGATAEQLGAVIQGQAPAKEESRNALNQFVRNAAGGLIRGAGSIGATLARPFDTAEENKERRARLDENMQMLLGADPNSNVYGGSKILAEIAGTAGLGGAIGRPVAAVASRMAGPAADVAGRLASSIASGGISAPGANLLTRAAGGAITGGATAGLVNPEDAGLGAMIGGAMPGAAMAAGKVGQAIGRQLKPSTEVAPLARRAMDMGAPLGVADVAEGKFTKAVRSVLNDAPMTGGIGAAQNEAKQKWFNRAVGEVFDAAEDKLTPEVMDAAKKKMGGEFDRIWNNNNLIVDEKLMVSLGKTRTNAMMLPKGERARIVSMLDDLESQITQAPDGSIVIPGDVANRYQSTIRKTAENAQSFLKDELTRLRGDMIGAFNRSVSPEDAAALALNQKKYKAFKTVEPLLAKGEVGLAGREAGDVPAALLPNAVLGSYKNNVAGSPLAELSRIGSKFIVDRTPQTGGSARAMIQNSAIGGALGAGMFTNPALALPVIPLGMGLNKALGSPALARSLIDAQMAPMGGLLSIGQKSAPVLIAQ